MTFGRTVNNQSRIVYTATRKICALSILNPTDIEEYLRTKSDDTVVLTWLLSTAKKWISNNELYLERDQPTAEEKSQYPWITYAVQEGTPLFRFIPNGMLDFTLDTILEWINSKPNKNFLKQTGFDIAFQEAEKWETEKYKKTQKDKKKIAPGSTKGRLLSTGHEIAPGQIIVMQWPDGYKIVQLASEEAFDQEGEIMNNCMGKIHTFDNAAKTDKDYYSLRDERNAPHVTFHLSSGALVECKGRGNHVPAPHYRKYIAEFLQRIQASVSDNGDFKNMGLLIVGDKICAADNMPTKVNSSVNLKGMQAVRLPEGFSVKGDLILDGSDISYLPEKLYVTGSLSCVGTKIRAVGEMTVLGDIDLSNTHIQFLPDGFTANRNLVVNNNAQFKHLPEGLTVLGDLCISRTSVHSLPENAKIGGDVVYSGTLQIPKSAVVSGTAYSLD